MLNARTSVVLGLLSILAGCGGNTVSNTGGDAPDSGSDAHRATVKDGGDDASDDATADATPDATADSAPACTEVTVTADDVTCTKDSDCTGTNTGKICEDTCPCGGTAVNNAGAARIATQVKGLEQGECECPAFGTPKCVDHACALCGGFMQPAGCAPVDCTLNEAACDGGTSDAKVSDTGPDA